jgi:hypothetical protein
MTTEQSPWVLATLPAPLPAEPRKKKSPVLTAIVPNATLNNLSSKKKQYGNEVTK